MRLNNRRLDVADLVAGDWQNLHRAQAILPNHVWRPEMVPAFFSVVERMHAITRSRHYLTHGIFSHRPLVFKGSFYAT